MSFGVSQRNCVPTVVETQPTRALGGRQRQHVIAKQRLGAGRPASIHDHRAALGQNIALVKVAPHRHGIGNTPAGQVHARLAKVGDLDEFILHADPVRVTRRLAVQRVVMAIRRLAGRVGQILSNGDLLLCCAGDVNVPLQRRHAFVVLRLKPQIKWLAGIGLAGGHHQLGRDFFSRVCREHPIAHRRHDHLTPGRIFNERLDHHRLAR